jgi:hypothetical protein
MPTLGLITHACAQGNHDACKPVVKGRHPLTRRFTEWRCGCDCGHRTANARIAQSKDQKNAS